MAPKLGSAQAVPVHESYEARKTRSYLRSNRLPHVHTPTEYSFSEPEPSKAKRNPILLRSYQTEPRRHHREVRVVKKFAQISDGMSSTSKIKIVRKTSSQKYEKPTPKPLQEKDYKIIVSSGPKIELSAPHQLQDKDYRTVNLSSQIVEKPATKRLQEKDYTITVSSCHNVEKPASKLSHTCQNCALRQLASLDNSQSIDAAAIPTPRVENSSSIELLLQELNSNDDDQSEKEWNGSVHPLTKKLQSEKETFSSCGDVSSEVSIRSSRFSNPTHERNKRYKLVKPKIKRKNGVSKLKVTKLILFCDEETYCGDSRDKGRRKLIDDEYTIPVIVKKSVMDSDEEENLGR